ncbi:MAG: sugar porter family MFS transporter [Actinomycetota bacterium]|nr:sugar porter family MFS transporter [Actinomycetota bacterium]
MGAAVVSAISSLLYGYDTGIISGALLQIKKDFHIGSGMQQIVASAILAGAILGAFFGSRLSERHGRRLTVLILACIFAVGALGSAAAPSPWLLVAGRVVLGFAVGGATQTVPMYVAELAPARHRGRLVLTFQVGIGVGILIATLVGAAAGISWRLAIALAAAPAVVMFVLMLRLPESPRWLVKSGDRDAARDTLGRIRADGADVEGELGDIEALEEHEQDAGDSDKGWRGLRRHWVRPALLVGCGIAVFTQLSGIEMIIYYSPTILTDNGFSTSAALWVSVGLGATYLVMMIVGLSIVDRIGRRRLTLTMIPGAALALACLGTLFATGHSGRNDTPFIIACLIVFMFFNAGGLQLMGWLTGSEIYPLAVRSAGTSAQAMTLWSTNLLISVTLLTIINAVGAGPTMWLYAAFNVAAFFFVWWRLPELTGRSLEQIEQQLHRGKFRPSDFTRLSARSRRGVAS